MPAKPEIIRSPESDAIVYSIHHYTQQVEALQAKLEDEKRELILLRAPAAIAEKIRANQTLDLAERVALAAAVAGKYGDANDHVCSVVVPTEKALSFDLYPKDAYKEWLVTKGVKKGSPKLLREFFAERETEARRLAGDHFSTLFDRFETFEPCKSFQDVLDRLLKNSPAKRLEVVKFLQVETQPQAPHVKLDKAKVEA
jgi:hypothetical protein